MTAVQVRLYATNGSTLVRVLYARRGLRVMEELNGVGGGEVTIPAAHAASIAHDQVIKVALDGTIVSGFVVEKIGRTHVGTDGLAWVTLSGRGLMAWLEDAVVYPQLGFSIYSPTDRPFTFAGVGGHWESRVTFTAPLGLKWSLVTDGRKGAPKGWPDPKGYWIWKTDPNLAVAANARNWFTATITTTVSQKLKFHITADNYFSLYLDGTKILSTTDIGSDGNAWKKMATRTLTVGAGTHRLAVAVANGGNGSSTNKAGLLVCVTKVTSAGKPGTIVRRSDLTHWQVTANEPRWYPSEIVQVLISEAITRGVPRMSNFTLGWADATDSTARAWTTTCALTVRCGTHYLDVVQQMIDLGIDFWMNPATNVFHSYETRGTDRSASVLLHVAKNLEAYETTSEGTGKTASLVRSSDGWTQASNTAGVAARGRRETYMEFGNTNSETTAAANAARILARTAKTTVTVNRVSAVPTADAVPLVSFFPGDRVTAVSSTGTATTARVLSVSVLEGDDGPLTYEPELEVLV